MPHLPREDKAKLDNPKDWYPSCVGDLTYVLYKACERYIKRQNLAKPAKFQDYAEAMGALESAKLEFYRLHVAPYEDKKIKENGQA